MEFIRIVFFLLVIFCRWYQNEAVSHDCSAIEFVCADEVENLRGAYRIQHRYVSANGTLDELCKLKSLVLRCVNSFAEECLSKKDQRMVKTRTKRSDKIFYGFCLEDEALRKKLLLYSECIRSVSTELYACTERYEASRNELNENEGDSRTLKVRICCFYTENIRCSSNAIFETCGQKAVELVEQLWEHLGGSYLNEVCHTISDHEMEDCLLASHATRLPVHVNTLSTVFSLLCSYITFHLSLHAF